MPTGINFSRSCDFHAMRGLMYVYIDGRHVAMVPYGGRQEFHLPPGIYLVQVVMGWCSSPPYQVEVWPGEMSEVEGGCVWRGFFQFVNVAAIFLEPGRFYRVRPTPPSRGPYLRIFFGVTEVVAAMVGFTVVNSLVAFIVYLAIAVLT